MKNKSLRKYKKNTKNKINKNDYRSTKKRRLNQKRGGAEEEDDEVCAICLDSLKDGIVVNTPCGHKFHKECLIQTCKVGYWRNNNPCLCPLCRGDIDEFSKKLLPNDEQFDPKHLTIITFPLYINYMLSILSEENPDDTLENLLLSFIGTDYLPYDVHDPIVDAENNLIPNIMQFKKMHVATRLTDRKPLYIYYFTGFIKKVPGLKMFRRNKKYYAFLLDEDGITYELDEIG
jgi:hypothetical protein